MKCGTCPLMRALTGKLGKHGRVNGAICDGFTMLLYCKMSTLREEPIPFEGVDVENGSLSDGGNRWLEPVVNASDCAVLGWTVVAGDTAGAHWSPNCGNKEIFCIGAPAGSGQQTLDGDSGPCSMLCLGLTTFIWPGPSLLTDHLFRHHRGGRSAVC